MLVHPERQPQQNETVAQDARPHSADSAEQLQRDWNRYLVEHSDDLLCVHSLSGEFLFVNPAPARALGYSVEELVARPMADFLAPEFRAEFETYLQRIGQEGELRGYLAVLARSGERRIWQYHNKLRTEGVPFPIVVGVAKDVTELRRTESGLLDRNLRSLKTVEEQDRALNELKLFRNLIDQCSDAIEVLDPKTLRLLDVNERSCVQLGYSREELLAMTVHDISPEFDTEKREQIFKQASECGYAIVERTHRRKDGSIFPVEVTFSVAQLDRTYGIAVARDITARKRVDEKLREFGRVVESLDEMVVVVDRNYRYTLANQSFLRYRNLTREQVVGHLVPDVISHQLFEEAGKSNLDECFAGKVVDFELALEYPSLGERQIAIRYSPIEGPNGIEGAACVIRDVTDRKATEARLKLTESRYRAVHELAPVGISWIDAQGRFIKVNARFCEIVGRSEDDLLHRDFQSITHSDDLKENLEKMGQVNAGELQQTTVKKRYIRPDGSIRWVEIGAVRMAPGLEAAGWQIGIVQDVTERKNAEERLRESEMELRRAQRVGHVGSWYRDVKTGTYTWSEELYRAFGMDPKKKAPAFEDLQALFVPESWERIQQATERLLRTGIADEMEVEFFRPDGSGGWAEIHREVMRDDQGSIIRTRGIAIDITARKSAELALRQSEMRERARSRELETVLAAVPVAVCIAHDPASLEISGNREAYRHFGLADGANLSLSAPENKYAAFRVLENGKDVAVEELPIQQAAASGKSVYGRQLTLVTVNGEVRETFANVVPLFDDEGKPRGAVAASVDITNIKKTEDDLRRNEEDYRMFVSQSSEGIFREEMDTPVPVDLPEDQLIRHILHDSHLAECNNALAAMYGFNSAEEFLGKQWTRVLPPEDPRSVAIARDYVRSGFRLFDHESHELDMQGNAKVFQNSMIGTIKDGKLVQTWGIQRDITEKAKLEESRRAAEEELRKKLAQLRDVSEELRLAKEKLSEEKLYFEQAIDTELGFGEIVGRSTALKEVMTNVSKVATSDATVLVLGETGTGKELVARALHRMSRRKNNSFIKLNCAAIPSGLLESELFGHEKGAFTGAVNKKIGRLELADHGTLFLDEIGEIPLNLQPKLLRVLQDQEFERLGGTQTIKVDFRLLAATNRDLPESVRRHEFRSDLYYRLNVFPIRTPALRERREDIPLLVEHFVKKCSLRLKKSVTKISAKTMEALMQWPWPGNIRELENFIDRSVILSPGSDLQVPLGELSSPTVGTTVSTLRELEIQRILEVLRECKGQLGGTKGAAARLGMKRTTLQSKLGHLGIKLSDFRDSI